MTERDDLDMLVAEFVLGTLPAQEREYVETRRSEDPEVEALILQWEERLGRLAEETEPVQPSPALFAKSRRLWTESNRHPARLPKPPTWLHCAVS